MLTLLKFYYITICTTLLNIILTYYMFLLLVNVDTFLLDGVHYCFCILERHVYIPSSFHFKTTACARMLTLSSTLLLAAFEGVQQRRMQIAS